MAKVTRRAGPGRAVLGAAVKSMEGLAGKVGWFSSSKYPDGTPVAYIATIHEFGYMPKHIPPRMGLRTMVEEKRSEWGSKMEPMAKQVFAGKWTGTDMLDAIGAVAEGDIRKQIASVTEPPLAQATIEARARRQGTTLFDMSDKAKSHYAQNLGIAKPLVDTGYLQATVTHIVAAKGGDDV